MRSLVLLFLFGCASAVYALPPRAFQTQWQSIPAGGAVDTTNETFVTWETNSAASGGFVDVGLDFDGSHIIAVNEVEQKYYISTDYGSNFTGYAWGRKPNWCAISSNGAVMYIADRTANGSDGRVYKSTDTGTTWNATGPTKDWYTIRCSADGTYVGGGAWASTINFSTNGGTSWESVGSSLNRTFGAISGDGKYMYFPRYGGQADRSDDYGATFVTNHISANWHGSGGISYDGKYQTKVVSGTTGIYTSSDYGLSWTYNTQLNQNSTQPTTICYDGRIQMACTYGGNLWISTDSGANWTAYLPSANYASCGISGNGKIRAVVVTTGAPAVLINRD